VALVVIVVVAWEAPTIPLLTASSGPKLLFSDAFAGTTLDSSKWNAYITSRAANGQPWTVPQSREARGGSRVGCVYAGQYYLPTQVSVDNGLHLTALRLSTPGWCNQTNSLATFAWRSGAVSTYNHFQFNGGYVAITMRVPSGVGMWPALWMLPGPGGTRGDDYEIDLQEGGFAPPSPADETYAWNLHRGSRTWGGVTNAGVDLSLGHHTYALNWISGQSMTWYLDGRQISKLTSKQASIPDEPMELIVDLAVADPKASGWHPPYDSTTSSPSVMQVSNVQVWSMPPAHALGSAVSPKRR
jgi:beta-glucanase (GH16 family)